jgi:hypothetical protein
MRQTKVIAWKQIKQGLAGYGRCKNDHGRCAGLQIPLVASRWVSRACSLAGFHASGFKTDPTPILMISHSSVRAGVIDEASKKSFGIWNPTANISAIQRDTQICLLRS